MAEPTAPPEPAFFERARDALGSGALLLALDDLELRLDGLDAPLAASLARRFGSFVGSGLPRSDALQVRVRGEAVDYFIAPGAPGQFNRILLACDGRRVRYLGHQVAGWFDTVDTRGELLLARGSYEKPEGAIENYIRAAVAWRAAERGGALVHAASAARGERGYLFYGASGAGKSTLAECNRTARVLSDDLTLVLPGADGTPQLVGSPFRGTYTGGPQVLGRFTLAAGFRLVQAPRAEVRRVPRVVAFSELVGNLPFVAEAFGARPDLFASVQRAFSNVPLARLHFRKDDSYWRAIDEAGL